MTKSMKTVTNTGKGTIRVGSVNIGPGQTAEVDSKELIKLRAKDASRAAQAQGALLVNGKPEMPHSADAAAIIDNAVKDAADVKDVAVKDAKAVTDKAATDAKAVTDKAATDAKALVDQAKLDAAKIVKDAKASK